MFAHLDGLLSRHPDGALPSAEINSFTFDGRSLRLTDRFAGIWKPAFLEAALTIRTTYTAPDRVPPYADTIGYDGLVRYAYQGTDADAADNRALREAWRSGVPLAYLIGVDKGVYTPIHPVWIVSDEPANLRVAVAVDAAQTSLLGVAESAARQYSERITKVRVHQRVFRSQVLRAYSESCAMSGCATPSSSTPHTSSPTATRAANLSSPTACRSASFITRLSTATSSGSDLIGSSRCARTFLTSTTVRCCSMV